MFFEEDDINSIINCPICHLKFVEPVILPCGETICKECLDDLAIKNLDNFDCLFCDNEHLIHPLNSFPLNKKIAELLEKQPKEVFRSDLVNEFKGNLNNLNEKTPTMLNMMESRFSTINDYFEVKRQQIQMIAETKINEINHLCGQFLDQFESLEKEFLENLNNENKKQEIASRINEIQDFCKKWIYQLKSPMINESEVREANEHSKRLLEESNSLLKCINKFIYNSKYVNFFENNSNLESWILGEIKTDDI